jgi:hypothetical protein
MSNPFALTRRLLRQQTKTRVLFVQPELPVNFAAVNPRV